MNPVIFELIETLIDGVILHHERVGEIVEWAGKHKILELQEARERVSRLIEFGGDERYTRVYGVLHCMRDARRDQSLIISHDLEQWRKAGGKVPCRHPELVADEPEQVDRKEPAQDHAN